MRIKTLARFCFTAGLAGVWVYPLAAAETHSVSTLPANIAPTLATRTTPVEVFGQPRKTKGHPNTYWDQEDIEHYKEMLKTRKELQVLLNGLREEMDKVIAEPINIPPPQQGPDGKWMFPGDYFPPLPEFPKDDPLTKFRRTFSLNSDKVSSLGTLYALTGEEKYAEYARKILLSFAVCTKYGVGPNYTMRSVQGLTGQLLDEALIMDKFARGYDLIYNLPSWTQEDRVQLHDELFYPLAACCLYPGAPDIDQNGCFASQANNRGLIGSVSVLMAGLVTEDQELINAALYGMHTDMTKPDNAKNKQFPTAKDWVASTAENPTHGLLTRHFAPDCIPGGMWVEGTPSYAFYALGSMVAAAEILWHHGIDLYRHNNAIFKNMFDFPLLMGYPDLTTPGLNDAHRESMLSGYTPTLYEYAYRRYRDPRYLAMINTPAVREHLAGLGETSVMPEPNDKYKPIRYLNRTPNGAPVSLLFDLDPNEGTTLVPPPSVNYPEVGFGILRTPAPGGKSIQSLILSSGPSASHGHPDKLHMDLYALDDVLMPSPGINFPYAGNTRIPNWYHTTVAHNTLTVDEKIQIFGTRTKARADQVVFAPASAVGLQRAWTDSVYEGVTMDRAVFMTPGYLADLFGVFSAEPHKYDLAWHICGEVKTDLPFEPMAFSEPVPKGYNTLTNVRQARVGEKPWSVTVARGERFAHLHAASGSATSVIVGDSGFYVDFTSSDKGRKPTAPTILERRENCSSTLYGNALDFSGSKEGWVKGVVQEGGAEAGFGLLRVTTAEGTDLCFAAYRPGNYKAAGLETDALQALVVMGGKDVNTLYLAGGTQLKAAGASLARSEPGLAYIEKTPEGGYILGNPSPTDATVTVVLPALSGLDAFVLDDKGGRGPAAAVTKGAGQALGFQLKAGTKVLFSRK